MLRDRWRCTYKVGKGGSGDIRWVRFGRVSSTNCGDTSRCTSSVSDPQGVGRRGTDIGVKNE